MVKNLRAILKSFLINGENPEVDNPQQGKSQLQRLNEKTPKGEATVRSMFITNEDIEMGRNDPSPLFQWVTKEMLKISMAEDMLRFPQ